MDDSRELARAIGDLERALRSSTEQLTQRLDRLSNLLELYHSGGGQPRPGAEGDPRAEW